MTLTRRTPTGRTLRLVTDEPTALEVEAARIRRERDDRRARMLGQVAAQHYLIHIYHRRPWWRRLFGVRR